MSYPPPQGQPLYPQADGSAPPQGYPPPQQQPSYNPAASLASGMDSMSLKARAGTTALLSVFTDKNIVRLEAARGLSLSINNGDVELINSRGDLAQFIVHVVRSGVVKLQNLHNTDNWIGFLDKRIVGTATGGPLCELLIGEVDGKQITLESSQYPGQFVSFNADGSLKAPDTSDSGPDSRFVPFLISENHSPPMAPANTHPPAQNPAVGGAAVAGALQGQPQQLPPYSSAPPQQQQQYPTASYPGQPGPAGPYPANPAPYPPNPAPVGYPPQGQVPYGQPPPQHAPPPPELPIHFSILDSFNNGCTIQLISRASGKAVMVDKGRISAAGSLAKNNSNWVVMVPPGVPQPPEGKTRVVMLRNEVWGGVHLSVGKGGHTVGGKANKNSYLIVEPQPDNYCQFSSVQFPGNYVNLGSSHQFFIRMEKQGGNSHTYEIQCFQRRSQANNLHSSVVLQMYSKANNTYLSINRNGVIMYTANEKDPNTFFVVVDRGMGIYSFNTRKSPGFRLRMENNVLKGKGISDLNADFRLKENFDGTVMFESVTNPNAFIGIQHQAGLQTNLNLKVVTIQRFGATENVSMTPLN